MRIYASLYMYCFIKSFVASVYILDAMNYSSSSEFAIRMLLLLVYTSTSK